MSDVDRPARALVRQPGAAELDPRRHARRQRLLYVGLGAGVPVALILLWQLASSQDWIDARVYPSPTTLASKGADLHREGKLWPNVGATSRRVAVGFTIGAALGIVVGMAMGSVRALRAAFEPLLNALYTVPKLALLPMFLIIFKYGEAPIYALVITTVFFFVWISTLEAMLAVPEGYREAALVLRVSRRQLFRHVLFPACLPEIFVGLRITAGVAVLVVIAVEFVYGGSGVGYLISQGKTLFIPEQTYVGIVIAALLGIACISIVDVVRRFVVPWAARDRAAGRA
jgi:sulfonate transport system permease protein